MKRIGGFRRNTRRKLSKNVRRKGKISIRRFFQKLKEKEKVYLNAEPAIQKGMYHPRFHNKAGTIVGKQEVIIMFKLKMVGKQKKY